MAQNQIVTTYDDAGSPSSAAHAATLTLGSATPVTVKSAPGRLVKIIVTTVTAGAVVTCFDNASAGSGTPLMVIPIAAAVGTIYAVDLPVVNGITVVSTGATGAVTIGFS